MRKKIVPTSTNPVVFPADDAAAPAWYYRAAYEETLHGPFPTRRKAIDYALQAMAEPATATAAKQARGRRAA